MASAQKTIDQKQLLRDVLSNAVNWKEALKIISALKKPWYSKEWKEQRKVLLAPQCENCGTTTPPLVLQHTWHPTPIHRLFYAARRKHKNDWEAWKHSHTVEVDTASLLPDAEGCPKCGSTTIRYRKKAQTWICVSKPKGIPCGNVFDMPAHVIPPSAIWKLEKAASQKIQEEFDEEFGIGKKVIITALEHNIRYLSLKDTKTLCKRCAFVEDRTKMVLCSICKNKYHSKKYDKCSACAGIKKEDL